MTEFNTDINIIQSEIYVKECFVCCTQKIKKMFKCK